MTARVLKVNDEKMCVEFSKGGQSDAMLFYQEFSKIKELMDEYANTAY